MSLRWARNEERCPLRVIEPVEVLMAYMLLRPDGVGEVRVDALVSGEERCGVKGRVGGDEAIEGVAGPSELNGFTDDLVERRVDDAQAERAAELDEEGIRRRQEPADLMEVLKLEGYGGRQAELLGIEQLASLRREAIDLARVEPGDDVRVEQDHGRHSLDQSIETRSAGSPVMTSSRRGRRSRRDARCLGTINSV